MAYSIFIAQVEMAVAIVGGLAMLPFLLFSSTTWMAQGSVSYPINKAFRFFILAILASALFPIIANELSMLNLSTSFWQRLFRTSQQTIDNLAQVAVVIVATWAIAIVFMSSKAMASGILAGQPVLSGTQAMQTSVGTAVTAVTIVGGAVTGGAIIGGGAVAGARGALAAHHAAQQTLFPPTGSATGAAVRGAMSGIAGSLGAGASHAGNRFQQGLIQGARYLHHDGGHGGVRPPI
jgi:hypothetical protein